MNLYDSNGNNVLSVSREISFIHGKYINTGSAVEIGGTVDLTNISEWFSLKYSIADCQEGDKFLLDVTGATNARAWAFITSDNVLISRSNAGEAVSGYIVAPQNAAKVIIQAIYRQTQDDTTSDDGTAFKTGISIFDETVRYDIIQDKTEIEKDVARNNIGAESGWISSVQLSSIQVEYGRANGTSFCLCRIPKTTYDGKTIKAKVAISNASKVLTSPKLSALDYAKLSGTTFCINSSLFGYIDNVSRIPIPIGFTIIDGVSITNDPLSTSSEFSDYEAYPLCIYSDGRMDTPYWNRKTLDTATMINDGVKYAVTAWGSLVYNYVKTGTDKFDETVHKNEHIPQQVVGQYQNGDYFVFTSDGARGSITNETGLTYDQVADILVSRGVKFAYALDGGGSAETVIGKRQLNPIYEGTTGRQIPVVIYFEAQ